MTIFILKGDQNPEKNTFNIYLYTNNNKILPKMIKITDKTVINTVYLPKLRPLSDLHIVLYGAGEEEYDLGTYEDLGGYENFYKVNLSLENIPDGEYKYSINDYERGLIIIGDLKETSKAPDDTDTYIQNDDVDEIVSFS